MFTIVCSDASDSVTFTLNPPFVCFYHVTLLHVTAMEESRQEDECFFSLTQPTVYLNTGYMCLERMFFPFSCLHV